MRKGIWQGTTSFCLIAAHTTFFQPINALAEDVFPPVQAQAVPDAGGDSDNPYTMRRNAIRAQLHGESDDDLRAPKTHQSFDVTTGPVSSNEPSPQASTTAPMVSQPPLIQPPIIAEAPPQASVPAEVQASATPPATVAPMIVQAGASRQAPPAIMTSPGVIIKKEVVNLTPDAKPLLPAGVLSPEQLAELIPAAGNADAPPAAPLIPAPDETSAPALFSDAPGSAAAPDLVPAPVPAQEAPAASAQGEDTAPVPAKAALPTKTLSAQTKAIAKKIPANLDKKPKPDKTLDIQHIKNTDYLKADKNAKNTKNDKNAKNGKNTKNAKNAKNPKANDKPQATEAMGIKIEVKTPPAYADHELELAYEALINGETEQAIGIYRNVLSNDPNNKNALFGLATTYHRAGQIDEARPLYSKLLSIDPRNRDALNNFLVLMADEAPEDALIQLQKLENQNPDFSPIPAQMAVIYEKLGNGEKASDKMYRAVALAPENLTYRYNLAIMLDKQHNYEEASKLYHQIIEAHQRGDVTPGDIDKIQERLTFIGSNRS